MGDTFRVDLTEDQVNGMLTVVDYAMDDQSNYLGSRYAQHDYGKEYPSVLRYVAEAFSACAEVFRQIPMPGCGDMAEGCSGFAADLREEAEAAETGGKNLT